MYALFDCTVFFPCYYATFKAVAWQIQAPLAEICLWQ
jgi:hypothetical protein